MNDSVFLQEMDRRSFNGPDFHYKVMWRKVLGSGPSWHTKDITSPPFVVTDVGNFSAFDIKVQAVNEMGEGPEPKSVIGYSGEDCKFAMVDIFAAFEPFCSYHFTLSSPQLSSDFSFMLIIMLSSKLHNKSMQMHRQRQMITTWCE